MRVAVFFENLGPYHVARLNAASRCCEVLGVEWRGRSNTYGWDSAGYCAEFEKHTLLSTDKGKSPNFNLREHLENRLSASSIDAVAVNGWGDFGALDAIWWAVKHSLPIVVMSESTPWDEPRKPWKEWIKRQVIGLFSAALAGGSAHRDYLVQLGMPAERIFLGYDAVDSGYFAAESAKRRKRKAESGKLKSEVPVPSSDLRPPAYDGCLPPKSFFLASARFIEKKNLFRLVEAYAAYRRSGSVESRVSSVESSEVSTERHNAQTESSSLVPRPSTHVAGTPAWNLVLLGDGPLRPALIAHARSLGLNVVESRPWEQEEKAETGKLKAEIENEERRTENTIQPDEFPISHSPFRIPPCIFMPGFKQYSELPEYYARASAFVHASTTEQWGLVVNEAMASGLPVLVSNRCGCARDLVQEGVNGFTFDPANVSQLAELMSRMANLPPSPPLMSPSGLPDGQATRPAPAGTCSAFNFPLSAFGDASRRIIADWGPGRFATGLKAAAEKAMEVGPVKATLMDRMLVDFLINRRTAP